jgi:hypothetical protein
MKRIVVAVALSMVPAAGTAEPRASRVDLNRPGALDWLARENPAHYEKVSRILDDVVSMPVERVPGWIRTAFDGRNVLYTHLVLTSYPPKRTLSFMLDDTLYVARVTLTSFKPRVIPGAVRPRLSPAQSAPPPSH